MNPAGAAKGDALALERFLELLDVHGSRVERWPDALRAPARALLDVSEPAKLALERAAALDDLLDVASVEAPSPQLSARIAAIPIEHPRRGIGAWWPFESVYRPVIGWLFAAVAGVVIGGVLPPGLDGLGGAAPSELALAEDGAATELDEQAWEELAELSLAYGLELEE